MKKVAVVVPLYINHPSLYPIVSEFFDSLSDNYPDIELIVIDDASLLAHYFPVTILNKENEGFTKTVNKGLKWVFTMLNYDIAIVLNDDLVIQKGDLDRFFSLEGTTIASPRDTASDDTDKWGAIWGITKEAYKLLGALDDKYHHYYSDVDYYDRAKKKGVTIIKWNDICVLHRESSTFQTLDKDTLLEEDKIIWQKNQLH